MKIIKTVIFLLISFSFTACATVPVTGRSQLDLIPQQTMLATSFTQYDDFMKQNKASTDRAKTEQVKRVGKKIQTAVEQYFRERNMGSVLSGYSWEFNLVESRDINMVHAWRQGCSLHRHSSDSKGRQRARCGNDLQIAHAVAKHGNERMSNALMQQLGGVALNVAMKDKPAETECYGHRHTEWEHR